MAPKVATFQMPVEGRVTDPFGKKRASGETHNGVDIAAPEGSSIRPIAPGVVVAVGNDSKSGNFVFVRHPDGTTSSYSHMANQAVQIGDPVGMQSALGTVGMTGDTTGPHVHLVVRNAQRQYVNPQALMGKPLMRSNVSMPQVNPAQAQQVQTPTGQVTTLPPDPRMPGYKPIAAAPTVQAVSQPRLNPTPQMQGSAFDAAWAQHNAPSSVAQMWADYSGGKMSPKDAAAFENAVYSGQLMLPPGVNFQVTNTAKDIAPLPDNLYRAYTSHVMDDDPDAQKAIEEAVNSGQVRLKPGQVLKRPPPRTTGELLGMGTRDVLSGAGGTVDMLAGPLNYGTNAVLGTNLSTTPFRDTANSVSDAFGFAKSESPTERTISGINEGGTAGLLTAGVGMAATGAKGTTGVVAQALADRPLLQVASGASAGLSAEKARQAGAGPVGQLAAGFAGGLAPFGLAPRVRTGAMPVEEVVVENPRAAVFEPNGELTPHGQEIASRTGVTAEELAAAYDAPPSVKRGTANDAESPEAVAAVAGERPVPPAGPEAPPITERPPVTDRAPPVVEPEPGVTPTDRVAAGQEFGVDYTRGQATKSFDIQDREQRLRASQGPEGDEMRIFAAKQNEQITAAVGKFREAIGDPALTPEQRGVQVQEAVRDLRDRGQAGVSKLYAEARELGAPVELDTAPIKRTFEGLMAEAEIPEPVKRVLEAEAARYGLIGEVQKTPEGALTNEAGVTTVKLDDGQTIKFRGEPQKLAIDNAENFRQVVSKQYMADGPRKLTQELKTSIDDAVEEAVARTAKGGDPSLAGAMKTARAAHVEQVKTFKAKDVVQDLIDWKKGTATGKLSPEQVMTRAFRSTSDLKKIKAVLLTKPTVASKQAWQTIQAHGVATIFDKATVRNTNIAGEITEAVSGAKLRTQIEAFGVDKLKVLLDPADFNTMMKLRRVIEDVTIPISGTTNPSGSGNLIMRIATDMLGKLPVGGKLVQYGAAGLKNIKETAERAETVKGLRYTAEDAAKETATPGQTAAKSNGLAEAGKKTMTAVKEFIERFKDPAVITPLLVSAEQEK